ncbi:MORN repeat-containing protein 2-like [Rhopilema esculentum]|uniref:MORN repeat-containing protein 2-like n=1 Tax=Rhopilema esculentum TaxID=499914 RepID=UPI0031D64E02
MAATGRKEKRSKQEVDHPLQQGVFMFPNGDKYDGSCKLTNGALVRTGYGELTGSDGTVYKGDWDADKMNGKGSLFHVNGSRYEGDFVNNMMHGYGTYTWSDGSKYEGTFCKNSLDGIGKFTDGLNQPWTGEFSRKCANGLRFSLNM